MSQKIHPKAHPVRSDHGSRHGKDPFLKLASRVSRRDGCHYQVASTFMLILDTFSGQHALPACAASSMDAQKSISWLSSQHMFCIHANVGKTKYVLPSCKCGQMRVAQYIIDL
jgi:hypothetical protein